MVQHGRNERAHLVGHARPVLTGNNIGKDRNLKTPQLREQDAANHGQLLLAGPRCKRAREDIAVEHASQLLGLPSLVAVLAHVEFGEIAEILGSRRLWLDLGIDASEHMLSPAAGNVSGSLVAHGLGVAYRCPLRLAVRWAAVSE